MRPYRIEKIKEPLHSFRPVRRGGEAYCKYGSLATYANRTQANNKCEALKVLGFDCYVSFDHPFLIILNS